MALSIKRLAIPFVLAAGLVSGCAYNDPIFNKTNGGTLIGAIGGGVIGSELGDGGTAATIIGTILGGVIGNQVGQSLDRADQMYAERAFNRAAAAPVGQQIQWQNPQSGNRGTVTATREGTHQTTGQYCREYQTTVTIGGQTQQAYGTACRQPDGSWQLQR